MTSDELQRAAELFHKICELPFSEQSAALDQACGNDEELRQEVLGLLAADRQAGGEFLNRPAIEIAAEQINLATGNAGEVKPGSILGKYQLVQQIGAGGMGVVYEAQDLQLMRRVALKILTRAAHERTDESTQRFLREARVAAQLSHPNIASIYDAGVEHGVHFIAMELVEGRTLRSLINAEPGRLEATRILELVGQTAAALSAAHAAGIVHRDIKPENIMIRPDGFVKVLDFGLAAVKEPVSSQGQKTCAHGPAMWLARCNIFLQSRFWVILPKRAATSSAWEWWRMNSPLAFVLLMARRTGLSSKPFCTTSRRSPRQGARHSVIHWMN